MPDQDSLGTITSGELARRVKSQFPQFANVPDTQLVEEVLKRRPEWRPRIKYEMNLPSDMKVNPPLPLGQRIAGTVGRWLPGVGGTAGGILGGAAGGPPGAVGGAALLGAGGEAANEILRELSGLSGPQSSGEAAKDIGVAGAEQGGFEAVGRFLPWGKIFSFRGAKVAGEEVGADELREMAKTKGIRMTPSQIRGAPTGIVEKFSQLGLLSERAMGGYERQTLRSADKLADDFLATLSGPATREQAGKYIKSAVDASNDAFKSEGGAMFAPFKGQAGKAISLDLNPLKDLTKQMRLKSLAPEIPSESPAGQLLAVMENVHDLPQNFDTGMQLREFIQRYLPGKDQMFADKEAERLAKQFWGTLSGQMERDAGRAGLGTEWSEARKFWSDGRKLFDSKVIQGIIKKRPEAVVDSVAPGNVTDIRAIKDTILSYGTPAEKARATEAWQKFQRVWAERRILGNPEDHEFNLNDLKQFKTRMDRIGGEQLREIYSDPAGQEFLKNMRTFSELMSRTDFKAGLGLGRWAVLYDIIGTFGGGGAGAAFGHPVEGVVGGFAAVEGIPRVLSAILHNKTATNLFLRSITAPPSSKALVTAVAQRIIAQTVKGIEEPDNETVH